MTMITDVLIWYLNVVINVCETAKTKLQNQYNYVIKLDKENIKNITPLKLICTRKQRHCLYKKLKGKHSKFIIYSTGKEDIYTYKTIYIKLK